MLGTDRSMEVNIALGGAIASLLFGSGAVILVEQGYVSIFDLDPIVPGLACSLFAFLLFSTIGKGAGNPNTEG